MRNTSGEIIDVKEIVFGNEGKYITEYSLYSFRKKPQPHKEAILEFRCDHESCKIDIPFHECPPFFIDLLEQEDVFSITTTMAAISSKKLMLEITSP